MPLGFRSASGVVPYFLLRLTDTEHQQVAWERDGLG